MENENKEKELDLIDLIKLGSAAFIKSLKWVQRQFLYFVSFNLRYWYILLPFIILGIAAVVYLRQDDHQRLQAEFVVDTRGVNSSDLVDLVTTFNQNIDKKDNIALVRNFGFTKETAEEITSFDAFYIVDSNGDGVRDIIAYSGLSALTLDTLGRVLPYNVCIQVKTKGAVPFQQVQAKMIAYLNKDSVLNQRCQDYIQIHREELANIEKEISALDSLRWIKSGKSEKLQVSNEGAVVATKDTYTSDMIGLVERRSSLLLGITRQFKPIVAVSPMMIKEQPSFTLTNLLIRLVGLSYLIALFISYCFSKKRNIILFIKNAKK